MLILALMTMVGCNQKGPEFKEEVGVKMKDVETVALGEACGGGVYCMDGLYCSDSSICVQKVADPNMICPETKDPVCGQKDGMKNGYLNPCEADRHGATIMNEGFCLKDESVVGNCEAEFVRIGFCDTEQSGVFFDGTNCVEERGKGCEFEIPFNSVETCMSKCQ